MGDLGQEGPAGQRGGQHVDRVLIMVAAQTDPADLIQNQQNAEGQEQAQPVGAQAVAGVQPGVVFAQ